MSIVWPSFEGGIYAPERIFKGNRFYRSGIEFGHSPLNLGVPGMLHTFRFLRIETLNQLPREIGAFLDGKAQCLTEKFG